MGEALVGFGNQHRHFDLHRFAAHRQPHREVHGGVIVFVDDDALFFDLFEGQGPGGDLGDQELVDDGDDDRFEGGITGQNGGAGMIFKPDVIQMIFAGHLQYRQFHQLIGNGRKGSGGIQPRPGQFRFDHPFGGEDRHGLRSWKPHPGVHRRRKIFDRRHGGLKPLDIGAGVDIQLDSQYPNVRRRQDLRGGIAADSRKQSHRQEQGGEPVSDCLMWMFSARRQTLCFRRHTAPCSEAGDG